MKTVRSSYISSKIEGRDYESKIESTEVAQLKAVASNATEQAIQYVELTYKKKQTNPEWFEKYKKTTYQQYCAGFNSWLKNTSDKNVFDKWCHLKCIPYEFFLYEDGRYNDEYREVFELRTNVSRILFNGYANFFEIDLSNIKEKGGKPSAKKFYVACVHNHDNPPDIRILESLPILSRYKFFVEGEVDWDKLKI